MPGCLARHTAALLTLFVLSAAPPAYQTGPDSDAPSVAPPGEVLYYRAEWRLAHAGNVKLSWHADADTGNASWQTDLHLESAGLVSKLYKVDDAYSSLLDDRLCVTSSFLIAREGSRHRETKVTYDFDRGTASYLERDLKKNAVVRSHEIDIPGCVYDVIGGLYLLRAIPVELGKTIQLPVSDGKKSVRARVEAQQRETVETPAGAFRAIRYEVFLFNDVLYRRKGRLYVWLTDDELRLPVQIRVRLQVHIGTITFQLEKVETT